MMQAYEVKDTGKLYLVFLLLCALDEFVSVVGRRVGDARRWVSVVLRHVGCLLLEVSLYFFLCWMPVES